MIPLLTARIPPTAKEAIGRVLDKGYIGGGGEVVREFERELARWLHCDPDRLVTTNSGTSALFLAYHVAGVRGGAVATTPMTFVATTTAIYQAGAVPFWIDVAERSCQIGAPDAALEAKIRWHMKAIVIVAWGGFVPDPAPFLHLGDALPLIVDAAQAIGAGRPDGRLLHEHADFTIYSFAPTKHLTTGDGGALVCRRAEDAERARRLAWFGMRRKVVPPERWPSDQDIPEAGFKLHMNNLAAALGLAGLPDLDATLAACRRNAMIYDRRIGTDTAYHVGASPWTYTVFVDHPDRFRAYMADHGVTVGQPHHRNDDNAFAARERAFLPNTSWAQAHYSSIPVGWWVTAEDAERIAEKVCTYRGLIR